MTGRVAVLREYGGEFELREYPVPEVEPGAILVKLTRAGVCGSDLHIWRGEMKEVYGSPPRDLTFGHEMCGRVARLGAGVKQDSAGQALAEGDRVTFLYFFPCGRCPGRRRIRPRSSSGSGSSSRSATLTVRTGASPPRCRPERIIAPSPTCSSRPPRTTATSIPDTRSTSPTRPSKRWTSLDGNTPGPC